MRYPASEKAEIIQLVEQSHLPAKRTLATLGIPRATFYRGVINAVRAVLRRWLTTAPDRIACGIASPTMSAANADAHRPAADIFHNRSRSFNVPN
jgi:transposase-like protein